MCVFNGSFVVMEEMVVFLIKKGGPKNFIQGEKGVSTIFTCTNGPLSIPTNHIKTNSRLN